ncbi:MAG: hypothetical protein E7633_05790 [Ruminococcaceae bacterium]|nr:hypothetical protein [Oscillospiraceae bacterium]
MKSLKEERVSLDGQWYLSYASEKEMIKDGYRDKNDKTLSTPKLFNIESIKNCGYDLVDASVPGNFELDLWKAGRCGDPYFGTNVFDMQKYEDVHQYYFRTFDFSGNKEGMYIDFEGIDTASEVFLNGRLILVCENMFVSHTVLVEDHLLDGENEIVVHIKPAVLFTRQYETDAMLFHQPYNYSSLHLRKAAGTYGWDILPRIVSGGLWRSVSLVKYNDVRIKDVFAHTVKTDMKNGIADVRFIAEVELGADIAQDFSLEIDGTCAESSFHIESKLWHTNAVLGTRIANAKFWMPRNYGDANLYTVCVKLLRGGEIIDETELKMGVRTVSLERTSVIEPDGTRFGKGEFCFYVNSQPIFAMGTNWVPADALHSRDRERLKELLPMLTDIGCNMVRCWGGNVYEHEDFYDFCDENGILIWQDFAMACGAYPQDSVFADKLRVEVEQIVRKYRTHPSLILWAGDNECDVAMAQWGGTVKRDPNNNILTRKVIPDVLSRLDLTRPYLPSSPYVDKTAYESKLPTSEDHTWGPRDYFKGNYYRNTICRFASEIGYHGCPEPSSLRKFISEDKLWNWREKDKEYANDEWMAHAASPEHRDGAVYAYRIPLMASHIKTLFGKEFEDLDTFAAASQISQAEAKKYFIEKFRIERQWRTGILWWNLVDGWPQISDAVVDYYGAKKLAYSYIRRAQEALQLMCDEPSDGKISLCCVSDLQKSVKVKWSVSDIFDGREVLCGENEIMPHTTFSVGNIPYADETPHYYLMTWSYEADGKVLSGKNHFISFMEKTLDIKQYVEMMRIAGYDSEFFFTKK